MTTICEHFANMYDLEFVKSKTKCLIFSKTVIDVNAVRPIILYNLLLPFFNEIIRISEICFSQMIR